MEIIFKSDITVDLVQYSGSDSTIAEAAWVSTGNDLLSGKKTQDDVNKLIPYLVKNRHGSPFEHGLMSFKVELPLFVIVEWLRHRIGWSPNGESGRYKKDGMDPVFYIPDISRPIMCVEGWKAGKPKFEVLGKGEPTVIMQDISRFYKWIELLKQSNTIAYEAYRCALDSNFDPGIARASLPENMYKNYWFTANPRSIMNFLSLRTFEAEATFPSYPLYEIDVAARKIEAIFSTYFPITHKAFCDNGRVAP